MHPPLGMLPMGLILGPRVQGCGLHDSVGLYQPKMFCRGLCAAQRAGVKVCVGSRRGVTGSSGASGS